MINLLPQKNKTQISASKLNVTLRHYIIIALLVFGLLFILMMGSVVFAQKQLSTIKSTFSNRQEQRNQYSETETKVKTLQKNISLIEKLFTEKTVFSNLIQDIAKSMPSGSYISKVSLTGNEKEPVELLINVDSPEKAGVLRNALNASERIKSVDVQSVSKNSGSTGYVVEIVIAFEPGAIR